jgi:hypothetical protein
MAQNKPVVKLMQLFFNDGTTFIPSEKEQSVCNDISYLFRQTATARNQNFQYFDGLNLIEYIEDSVRRFNTNIDEREGIEDWQAAVHDSFTRNKVLGILGRVLEALPIVSFAPRGEEEPIKAEILTDLYHFTEEQDGYDELMIHILLEAIVKGKAIGYEDIYYDKRKVRDVVGIGDKIKVTETDETIVKMVGSLIPLEDFYPSSVSIRDVKNLPFAFVRKSIPYTKFLDEYGHYKKSELVEGKRAYGEKEPIPYYVDFIDVSVPEGSVEVIKYFDKMKDEFIIIANGIWLNPIKDSEDTECISPLPWNHKELPFWEVKYDIFGDFFYGKSLPDRLKAMQDVLNVLTNMLLDQSFLTIFPPLLTSGMDDIEDDYLRPGRRTPVDTQGMPLANAFHVLQTPTPQGWHQFILQYTRSVMEEASMDKVSQGVAGQGDRTTKYEIQTAAAGVAAMLQLFARFINSGLKRKAILKNSNTLQFGMSKDTPLVKNILKSRYADLNAFQTFVTKNAKLTGGKRGTRIVEMFNDKSQIPSKENIVARAALAKLQTGNEFEIINITPEYIRNVIVDVELVTNPRSEKNKQAAQQVQVQKVQMYSTFFPDLINRKELASQTMEKFGDKPEELIQEKPQPLPQEQGAMPGQGGEQGPPPIDHLQDAMTQ